MQNTSRIQNKKGLPPCYVWLWFQAANGGAKPGVIASVHAKMFRKKFTSCFVLVQQYMGQGDGGHFDLPRSVSFDLGSKLPNEHAKKENRF